MKNNHAHHHRTQMYNSTRIVAIANWKCTEEQDDGQKNHKIPYGNCIHKCDFISHSVAKHVKIAVPVSWVRLGDPHNGSTEYHTNRSVKDDNKRKGTTISDWVTERYERAFDLQKGDEGRGGWVTSFYRRGLRMSINLSQWLNEFIDTVNLTTNTGERQSKWVTGFGVSGRLISRREMRDKGESVDLQKGDDS
jgi:hypothetical protein